MLAGLIRPLYSHEEFLATRRFPAFDGIRALAALMVVAFHFAGPRGAVLSGWLGVHLFFVLSGFLITTLLLREETANDRISLADFWIRRVFRIVPAYYVVLAAIVVLIAINGHLTLAGVPQSIGWFVTLNPDLAPTTMGFTPAWTIGIEQKFYLVWPVIAFLLIARIRFMRPVIWALALCTLLALTLMVSSSFVHYVVILFGCGLAILMHSAASFRVARYLATRLAGVIGLAGLIIVLPLAPTISAHFHGDAATILIFGFFAAVALPGICATTFTSRVLSAPPLRWMGDRSYSIYLLQVLAGELVVGVVPGGPSLRTFIAVVIVVLILADVLHRWVELPGIRLGKRLVDRRARSRGRAPALTPLPTSDAATS